jgi:hypothetical protein
MSKIITFSQRFQSKHPRKGEPTYFVEQILNQLKCDFQYQSFNYWTKLVQLNHEKIKAGKLTEKQIEDFIIDLSFELDTNMLKLHTIRNGHRFAVGEKFTPVVWSGKPYHTPQIIFYDDIEVLKTYNIMVDISNAFNSEYKGFYLEIPRKPNSGEQGLKLLSEEEMKDVAKNDGLSISDFKSWFGFNAKKTIDFSGQAICWEDPKYLEV